MPGPEEDLAKESLQETLQGEDSGDLPSQRSSDCDPNSHEDIGEGEAQDLTSDQATGPPGAMCEGHSLKEGQTPQPTSNLTQLLSPPLHLLDGVVDRGEKKEDDIPDPDGQPMPTQGLSLQGAPHHLKWDLPTGRVGDPPGLGNSPGSSHLHEVKPLANDNLLDDALYPPMDQEELDQLDGILLDLRVVPTGQGEHLKQENQQDQRHHQQSGDLHSTQPYPHSLDLTTGRVGDPPGLDLGLGSSHQ